MHAIAPTSTLIGWRHPRPVGAQGRCIGRTDLVVDRRKAKRLAHRIRQAARRHGWPRVVHTSPLQRCADVGRQLRRWGWRHHIHPDLLEMDFGVWDGVSWSHIPHQDVDAWCQRFADQAPGGGESLRAMLDRVAGWLRAHAEMAQDAALPHAPRLLVAHAGWLLAADWVRQYAQAPERAEQWPAAPAYGQCWALDTRSLQYRPVEPASFK